MDKNTYKNLLDEAAKQWHAENLGATLAAMQSLATELADAFALSQLAETQSGYQALVSYFRTGAPDADRDKMYRQFMCQANEVWCALYRRYLIDYSDTAYSRIARTLRNMEGLPSLTDLLSQDEVSLQTLFEVVWTAELFTQSTYDLVSAYLSDETKPLERKKMILTALTLATLEVFDAYKLRLLCLSANNEHPDVMFRALLGATVAIITHPHRTLYYPTLSFILDLSLADPGSQNVLIALQLQLLMSKETKNMTRSLHEAILPEVMKRTQGKMPQTQEDFFRLNAEMAELGLNPDWEKDPKRNAIGKIMQRFMAWQEKGADVYISSFSMLKNRFPFFQTPSNWFLSFDPNNPALHIDASRREFADIISKLNILCESDKYSLALLVNEMPQAQFDMLQNQFRAMVPENLELPKEDVEALSKLRTVVQDFYRFATLYPHNDRALNPFRHNLLLTEYKAFDSITKDERVLQEITAFLFDEGFYDQALPLLLRQVDTNPTARLWQEIGYCYQRQDAFADACEAYDRSTLFGEPSAWTKRQLAVCHRAAGHYEEALRYYDEMAATQPDDISLLIHRAYCLEHLGKSDEALNLLHKADYLEETAGNGTRALMETLIRAKQYEQAVAVSQRLIEGDATPHDRLLAAHAVWLSGDTAEAVARYKGYYSRLSAQERAAHQAVDLLFKEHRNMLLANGKTKVDLQIMADAASQL